MNIEGVFSNHYLVLTLSSSFCYSYCSLLLLFLSSLVDSRAEVGGFLQLLDVGLHWTSQICRWWLYSFTYIRWYWSNCFLLNLWKKRCQRTCRIVSQRKTSTSCVNLSQTHKSCELAKTVKAVNITDWIIGTCKMFSLEVVVEENHLGIHLCMSSPHHRCQKLMN